MIEYIGVDIGGTNIRVCGIDKNNNMVCFAKEKTLENINSPEELYNKIRKMIEGITEYDKVKGIGIGCPGAVDKEGKITSARNVPFLKDFPLVEKLERDLKTNVQILNDARVAALAEAVVGAGKKYNNVCYITISTGLGGGSVIDKKVYEGGRNLGAYFSRMILDGENIAENLISGTALINRTNEVLKEKIYTAQEVFMLSKKNKEVEKIVEEFKRNLVNLLLNISITLSPEVIVIGGGLMKAKKYFFDDVKSEFKKKAHRFASETVILEPKLKEPGVIGAALYAKSNKI